MVNKAIAQNFLVSLSGSPVGNLVHVGDFTRFDWLPQYWRDPQRPVLGLQFEDNPAARHASALRLPPWFSNLLPEGSLREWVAKEAFANPQREMELLQRIGTDLPGAVQVSFLSESPSGDWAPEDFEQATAAGREKAEAVRENSMFRFSLAGVGVKFSMVQRADRITLPSSGEDGKWILKLPDGRFAGVPENEFATMRFASQCGIEIPEILLVDRNNVDAIPDRLWNDEEAGFAIRRFDRSIDADKRIHIEDFIQVRGEYSDRKYSGNYETAALLAYRNFDQESLGELIRRIIFSYLIGNGDLHWKNLSLIYSNPRSPKLSPAYDLISTAGYAESEGRAEDMALKMLGTRRMERISAEHFIHLGTVAGQSRAYSIQIIHDIISHFRENIEEYIDSLQRAPVAQNWIRTNSPKLLSNLEISVLRSNGN